MPKNSETDTNTFSDNKFFRNWYRYFFRYQIFSKPIPILCPIPNFFETDTDTFSNTKNFQNRYQYHQKKWKSFETEKFRNQNVTLWSKGTFFHILPLRKVITWRNSQMLGTHFREWQLSITEQKQFIKMTISTITFSTTTTITIKARSLSCPKWSPLHYHDHNDYHCIVMTTIIIHLLRARRRLTCASFT